MSNGIKYEDKDFIPKPLPKVVPDENLQDLIKEVKKLLFTKLKNFDAKEATIFIDFKLSLVTVYIIPESEFKKPYRIQF
jgi:hypothetical protein